MVEPGHFSSENYYQVLFIKSNAKLGKGNPKFKLIRWNRSVNRWAAIADRVINNAENIRLAAVLQSPIDFSLVDSLGKVSGSIEVESREKIRRSVESDSIGPFIKLLRLFRGQGKGKAVVGEVKDSIQVPFKNN